MPWSYDQLYAQNVTFRNRVDELEAELTTQRGLVFSERNLARTMEGERNAARAGAEKWRARVADGLNRVKELEAAQTPRPMGEAPPDGAILGWDSVSKSWGTIVWDSERGGWWSDNDGCRIKAWLPYPPDPEETK